MCLYLCDASDGSGADVRARWHSLSLSFLSVSYLDDGASFCLTACLSCDCSKSEREKDEDRLRLPLKMVWLVALISRTSGDGEEKGAAVAAGKKMQQQRHQQQHQHEEALK